MIHVDIQQITVFAIVTVAAFTVGRRMTRQLNAFKKEGGESPCDKCCGCSSSKVNPSGAKTEPLIQIQIKPSLKK